MKEVSKYYKLDNFLEDEIFDIVFGDEWWNEESPNFDKEGLADILGERLQEIRKTICNLTECKVVMDHCHMAAHDYCLICKEVRPGQALNRKNK